MEQIQQYEKTHANLFLEIRFRTNLATQWSENIAYIQPPNKFHPNISRGTVVFIKNYTPYLSFNFRFRDFK